MKKWVCRMNLVAKVNCYIGNIMPQVGGESEPVCSDTRKSL